MLLSTISARLLATPLARAPLRLTQLSCGFFRGLSSGPLTTPTPSERQIRDALNVAVTQWPTLDQAYLRKWVPELGVADPWEHLLAVAEKDQRPIV